MGIQDQDLLTGFIRKWGNRVSYIRPPEGGSTVVGSDEAAWEFLAVATIERQARVVRPGFSRKIDPSNAEHWRWDEDILLAKMVNGMPLQKFSWNPVTGEFLFVSGGNHASARGKAPFDDYVRGIILPQQKKVTFRPFYPTWMQDRSTVQQFHEDGEGGVEEVSYDAQQAAEKALKASGSRGWTFQYNINNRLLEEMTGNHRW